MDEFGLHSYLPWLRQGIGALQKTPVDWVDPLPQHIQVPVALNLNKDIGALTANLTINIYGPGNVSGFDPHAVIRTWPRDKVLDAESNYFPLIEFLSPDLPWRYTPAGANSDGRLRPWMALLVLAENEIESVTPGNAQQTLPSLKPKADAPMPDISQSWSWAHVQESGTKNPQPSDTATLLQYHPERVISRLMSLRKLSPKTAYHAFLVPLFEQGRLAGLNKVPQDDGSPLDYAWKPSQPPSELPIFFQWSFQTSDKGDFKYFVNLLQPKVLPADVGVRKMNVQDPGLGLPKASDQDLELEGALMSPAAVPSNWPDATGVTFINDNLKTLLNVPADRLDDPNAEMVFAPPLYGQWHAAQKRLNLGQQPIWFQSLNRDPRYRVGAGLGTLVVQSQQQQLLAGAWQQVGDVRKANERLRHAQLSREASIALFERHLSLQDAEEVILATQPLHSRILGSPVTIKKLIHDSPVTPGALEPQLRRTLRPLGPIGRRQGRADLPKTSTVLGRMNSGQLKAAPPPPTPSGVVTPQALGSTLLPSWLSSGLVNLLGSLRIPLLILAVILVVAALLAFSVGASALGALLVGFAVAAAGAFAWINQNQPAIAIKDQLRQGQLTPQTVQARPSQPQFVIQPNPVFPSAQAHLAPGQPGTGMADSPSAQRFRAAATAYLQYKTQPIAPGPQQVTLDLASVRTQILAGLDPRQTFRAAYVPRLKLIPGLKWSPSDPIDPVMAAPSFDQPMYRPLQDLSSDWLVPGLDQLPDNIVTLLANNQKFIESYMAGLNHEMARKLLFNGYPTDQRGTYFRQFWDVAGVVNNQGQPPDPNTLKDITPMNTWNDGKGLGQHSPRPGGDEGKMVLLVRGQLLQRYPTTQVYACKAVRDSEGNHILSSDPADELQPMFHAFVGPDLYFFGFELDKEQAKGGQGNEGWFFVLQQHPSEPEFGVDITAPNALDGLLASALGSGIHAGTVAAQAVRIPVRVAVHGSRMLKDL